MGLFYTFTIHMDFRVIQAMNANILCQNRHSTNPKLEPKGKNKLQ